MQPVQPIPSPPPKFTDAILLSVLSLSGLQVATSMMATCHFLYHEGAKIVLHHFPVVFGVDIGKDKALAVLRFVKAEQLSRCSYVRNLHVSMDPMPSVIAASLARLLPRMSSLETLVVTIEHTLQVYPRLLPAFASLQSVKTLTMMNTGKRSCELLKTLQSQLVLAKIYFAPIDPASTQPPPLTPDLHPLTMLQRSAPTLETLLLGFWIDVDFGNIFFRPAVTYPKMNAFIVHECLSSNLLSYINSFPNLTLLIIKDDRPNPWEEGHQQVSEFHRSINLEVARGAASSGEPVSWKHLKDYGGQVVDLWLLGLTCPIASLELEDTPTTRPPLALTDVLAHTRPSQLTINFKKSSLTDVLASDFLGALRTEGASGVTSLTFSIELTAKDRDVDVGRALADISATISRLKLTYIQIAVTDVGLDDPSEPEMSGTGAAGASGRRRGARAHTRTRPGAKAATAGRKGTTCTEASATSGSLSVGERTMDAFDIGTFLSDLADTISTLEGAYISIPRPRRCGSEGRVARMMDAGAGVPEGGILYRTR